MAMTSGLAAAWPRSQKEKDTAPPSRRIFPFLISRPLVNDPWAKSLCNSTNPFLLLLGGSRLAGKTRFLVGENPDRSCLERETLPDLRHRLLARVILVASVPDGRVSSRLW